MNGPSCTDSSSSAALAAHPTSGIEAGQLSLESVNGLSQGTSQSMQQLASSVAQPKIDGGADGETPPTPQPLSKSQLKKRTRWQKSQAIKQRRKEQSREVKRLKAQKAGRDLDAERQQQERNQQDGSGRAKREEKWKQIMANAHIDTSFRVCFDCAFEDHMTYKETNSLSLQLRYTYAKNRRSPKPVYIDVSGLSAGCKTREHLENVEGFPESWLGRAFRCHEGSFEEVYGTCVTSSADGNDREGIECDNTTNRVVAKNSNYAAASSSLPPNHKFVYLTGDSPNTLTTLNDNTTYIIGGIVDRNRLKFAAIERAASINAKIPSLNIQTARLPLDEHVDFKGSTRILTCNHVFEILQRYRENGYTDWRGSIMAVLPCRKDVEEKKEDKNSQLKDESSDEKTGGL